MEKKTSGQPTEDVSKFDLDTEEPRPFQPEPGENTFGALGSMRPGSVLRLHGSELAWNADGSADATTDGGESWIAHAEARTSRRRGRCSYSGCNEDASVGGHIFISRRGVWIAPICSRCNAPNNRARWQGAGSTIRVGTEVTKVERTEGMFNAERRMIAVRVCHECDNDISDRPEHHDMCLGCYRLNSYEQPARRCKICRSDVSDRPDHHDVCLNCYRKSSRTSGRRRRECGECGDDISDRPPHHHLCLHCYRQ
jgi:hypothetical protein